MPEQVPQMQVWLKRHTSPHWFHGYKTLHAADCEGLVPEPAEPSKPCRRLRRDSTLLQVVHTALHPHPRTPLVHLGHVALQQRYRQLYTDSEVVSLAQLNSDRRIKHLVGVSACLTPFWLPYDKTNRTAWVKFWMGWSIVGCR